MQHSPCRLQFSKEPDSRNGNFQYFVEALALMTCLLYERTTLRKIILYTVFNTLLQLYCLNCISLLWNQILFRQLIFVHEHDRSKWSAKNIIQFFYNGSAWSVLKHWYQTITAQIMTLYREWLKHTDHFVCANHEEKSSVTCILHHHSLDFKSIPWKY